MPFVSDAILDNLSSLAGATVRVDICYTAEPTTYAQATSTNSCGNKTGITAGSLTDGPTDGRKVTIPAITDGSVTATQTAGWYAITDGTSVLHATGALSATQAVTNGNTFTLDAIDITNRDATQV